MLVKFKKSLLIEGFLYKQGVQVIEDAKLQHPHFKRYVEIGYVTLPEKSEIPEVFESAEDRNKRMAEREAELQAKKDELLKKTAPPKEDEEKSDEGKKKSKKG